MKSKTYLTTTRLFIILLFCVSMTIQTSAAPGDLDPSFGNGGKVVTSIGKRDLYGSAVAVQADGKIVTAGSSKSVLSLDFALARFNADGSFDQTFGGGGKVTTDFGGTNENVTAIAIQTDGKIVAVGNIYGNRPSLFMLARYNSDGSLDTTFDGDGQVFFKFDNSQSFTVTAYAAAIQPDGRIVAAGIRGNDFTLARLNSDGTLDTTFNGDGKVITVINNNYGGINDIALRADGRIIAVGGYNQSSLVSYNSNGTLDTTFDGDGKLTIPTGGSSDQANDVAIQADGKIVTAGGSDGYFALTRHNADGSLDTTFDGDGIVTTAIIGSANAIAIQSDGRIVVAGSNFYGSSGFALARFNPDGSPDTTFDGDGQVITTFAGYSLAYALDLAIQADGKIVAAGYAATNPTSSNNSVFALARFNNDGSLDSTFDGDGKVTTAFAGYSSAAAYDVAIQADGKIVAAGYAGNNQSNFVFALARFNNNGSLDTSFDGDGKVTTDFNRTYCGASAVAIQADGKIVAAGYSGLNFSDFVLARFNNDGSLDATFDGDGKVITNFGNAYERAYALAIQADGKIVAVGEGGFCDNDDYGGYYCWNTNIALARYNSNGSLDTGFSGDGKVTDDFGGGGSAYAYGIAIKSGGRIVVAGTVSNPDYDFFLAQYQSNSKAAFDFDGDGKSDISVFRPSSGIWYINGSQTGFSAVQFGIASDKLTPDDFDGDGKTDIAVYRDGVWYWLNSSDNSFSAYQFGIASDIPVPADYTGDRRAELAVYRGGFWFTLDLTNNQFRAAQFGLASDKPVAADYDGDGKADYAVVRQGGGLSIWYISGSTRGFYGFQFGTDTDKLVPADYDNDGKTDVAVYRNGFWYISVSTQFLPITAQLGTAGDIPVPADYDGDGKADIAIYRNGIWHLQRSTSGFTDVTFGANTDKPVPNAFLP